jgi:hypothetical protein
MPGVIDGVLAVPRIPSVPNSFLADIAFLKTGKKELLF